MSYRPGVQSFWPFPKKTLIIINSSYANWQYAFETCKIVYFDESFAKNAFTNMCIITFAEKNNCTPFILSPFRHESSASSFSEGCPFSRIVHDDPGHIHVVFVPPCSQIPYWGTSFRISLPCPLSLNAYPPASHPPIHPSFYPPIFLPPGLLRLSLPVSSPRSA